MNETLVAILTNSVVLAAVGFGVKSIINRHLDRDTERFKATLQATTANEVELYRANLEKERIRLQISYGGIFEKQADALLEIYRLSNDYCRHARWALDAGDDQSEVVERFKQSWKKLYDSYKSNRVLLPDRLDTNLRIFVDDFYVKVPQHIRGEKQYERVASDVAFDRLWGRQEKLREAIEKDMPALLEQIVAMMRELLGAGVPLEMGESNGT